MGAAAGPDIIEDGLVLCLDAANRQSYAGSGTVWRDLAGSNNGTLTNGPTFNSANGGSIAFDGTNDYCSFSNSSGITRDQPKSVFIWIYPTSVDTNRTYDRVLIHKPNSTDHFTLVISGFGASPGYFKIGGTPNNNLIYGMGTAQYPINNWYYIGFIWDGSNFLVYCNTYSTSTLPDETGSFGLGGADRGIYLGTRLDNSVTYYIGKISNFKLYNRALTPAEIEQNYNATKGRFGL